MDDSWMDANVCEGGIRLPALGSVVERWLDAPVVGVRRKQVNVHAQPVMPARGQSGAAPQHAIFRRSDSIETLQGVTKQRRLLVWQGKLSVSRGTSHKTTLGKGAR